MRSSDLIDLIYGHDKNGGPDGAHAALFNIVVRTNRKLKPFNMVIRAKSGQGSSCYSIVAQEQKQNEHDLLHVGHALLPQ